MNIISSFTSFICIVTFNVWKFKSNSFDLYKQFDCDFMKVYQNNSLFHNNFFKINILNWIMLKTI